MPRVTIEFYGIPKERIGLDQLELEANSLGEVCEQLAAEYLDFANSCLNNHILKPEYLVSINGKEFTRDPLFALHKNDSILILNADVGG